jgi:uncharacterized protein
MNPAARMTLASQETPPGLPATPPAASAPSSSSSSSTAERVYGFDVARSLAILGMIVVHFCLVMSADGVLPPAWLKTILYFLDGRATATFMILAGVGITLMTRRAAASGDAAQIADARRVLVRRGVLLLAVGFVNLTVWAGDILRIYGVSLIVAALLITASNRRLLASAAGFVLGFILLFGTVDFDRNWNWDTMEYRGLWTAAGVVRNLFYDGFRSVFPWAGMILLGMWVGRLNLRDPRTNRRVLLAALVTAIAAELVSRLLERIVPGRLAARMATEVAHALFGTESMPALPLFLLAAGGTALAVIALSVRVTETWRSAAWFPLAPTGQMALTWYVAHIVLGLGAVVHLGLENSRAPTVAAAYGAGFFVLAVLVSTLWKLRFRHGPLEWVMRKVAG